MKAEQFDAILIGSGQGANPLTSALARAGRRTAIIERGPFGGTCINTGCTPTKTMIASARVAYLARRAADFGVRTGAVEVDQAVVRQRKRDIVEKSSRGGAERVEKQEHAELIAGSARFISPDTVEVRRSGTAGRRLSAGTIVIDTGARPAVPELPGLAEVPFLDSTTIMELDAVPEHLLVLGGGYVGLEFAQMFRRFGSGVTLIQRDAQLLTREDGDVAAAVLEILQQDGIEVLLRSEAHSAARHNGGILLRVRTPGGTREVAGSHLLVAVGRRPNTEDLDPERAGIEIDERGYIRVNDRLETGVPGIYAIGDVNGGPAFTHISYDDYRILRDNLLAGANRTRAGRLVPYVVYIDPELGRVGMTEAEARGQGREIRVARLPMSSVARALERDETRGLLKGVVDAASGEILGVAMLGIHGGELMSMCELAMAGGLTARNLSEAILAHPTLAEALNNLFAQVL